MSRRAFARVELLTVLCTALVLVCVLMATLARERGQGWQTGSISNLHEFAAAHTSFVADHSDVFCYFSWASGVPTPSQYPDLQPAPYDATAAAAAQAVDILRRRAGRTDIPPISGWSPFAYYHHLPLADYLGASPLLRFTVSPGDANRLAWSNDTQGFDAGAYLPNSPDPTDPQNRRWPYSSSYRVPMAFGTPDATSTTHGCISMSSTWGTYISNTPVFNVGGRRITEVNYPSQKVFVFDQAQWDGAKQPVFFGYAFARTPMLMVDGSSRVRATGQANIGFRPDSPRYPFGTQLAYYANPWDPPVLSGIANSTWAYYWFTRGGIQGRDFEGPEIDTSTW